MAEIRMVSGFPRWPRFLLLSACLIMTSLDFAAGQNNSDFNLSKASCKFALDLLKTVSKEGNENVVMSPSSIGVLLAVLQQGAQHNTLTQLENLLHLTSEQSKNEYRSALQLLQAEKGNVILEWGNRAYVRPGFQVKDDYNKTVSDYFGAAMEELDFTNPSTKAAADKMNQWVEDTTHGVIKDFVPPSLIGPDTVLVLLNAIYFKGLWDEPFEKTYTKNEKFESTPGNFVEVPFMYQNERLKAGKDDKLGFSWVELEFKEKKFAMLFVLPTEKHGLTKVMDNFDGEVLRKLINSKESIKVYLNLPKFKLKQKKSLKKVLKQLGLTDVFEAEADLSGITPMKLQVSEVLHEASVEIDEEGSVAAGATGIFIVGTSLVIEPTLDFTANHPFLFFIIDKVNKVPLFMGKVFNPSA